MITLKIITPAKDRQGQVCSSYHSTRTYPRQSLVKTGVSRTTETFPDMTAAYKYMQKHPGNGYEVQGA